MKVTQEKIAQDLGLHPATVSKILNRVPTDYTSVETRQKVFDLALKLGYDFKHLKSAQREHPRNSVDIPVKVVVVIYPSPFSSSRPLVGGEGRERVDEVVWDRGQARVCDIRQSGALLADLQLSKNTLPLQPFRLKLILEPAFGGAGIVMPKADPPLAENTLSCQVVRLETDDRIKVGLKFETVPEETRWLPTARLRAE